MKSYPAFNFKSLNKDIYSFYKPFDELIEYNDYEQDNEVFNQLVNEFEFDIANDDDKPTCVITGRECKMDKILNSVIKCLRDNNKFCASLSVSILSQKAKNDKELFDMFAKYVILK